MENLGFGKANNKGLKYAINHGADFCFLLNPDAWVEKDTIEILVKAAIEAPKYGILSPIHLNNDGSRLDNHFNQYIIYPRCKNFVSDLCLGKGKLNVIYDCQFINAAARLMSRKCILEVGGLIRNFLFMERITTIFIE